MRNWDISTWGPAYAVHAVRTVADQKSDALPAVIHFETKAKRQERRAADMIARERRRILNRLEWERRAEAAHIAGDITVYSNITRWLAEGHD